LFVSGPEIGVTAQAHGAPVGAIGRPLPLGTAGIALGIAAALAAAATAVALGPSALAVPVGGAIVYVLARNPLVLYVSFLYVGLFKGEPVLRELPVDATLLLGLLLGAVFLHRTYHGRVRLPPLMLAGPVLLIAVLMAISLIWTPVPDYGLDKTLKFATFTLAGAFAPFFLIEDRAALKRLLVLLALAAAAGALVVLTFGTTSGQDDARLEFSGAANTIFTSRFLLTGAFLLLLAPALRLWKRQRTAIVVGGVAVIAVAASIGSRGPVVALALALVCTAAAVILREPRRILPLMLLVAVGVAVFPLITLPETSAERLSGLVQDPSGTLQEDLRSRLYAKGLELAQENPVRGIGTGGFFLYSYVVTDREERYPHNVFLETGAELGLAPTLLLAISVAAMLMALYRRAWQAEGDDRSLIYLVAGVFLLNFFAAQFSGDFNDNKTFWAFLGVGWLVARYGVALAPPASQGRRKAASAKDR
jgi:O-antigen ligase